MERSIVLVALFAALIAALGLIPKIMLTSGVPITAQSLGIMLCGTVLGAKRGGAAALLFVLLTLAGLPLLAGGRGGLGLLASPTVGFIIGFPLAAFAAGWIMERFQRQNILVVGILASIVGGIIVLYIPGVLGMSAVLGKSLSDALVLMLPFITGDLIKAALAGFVTQAIYRARPHLLLSRH